MTDRPLRRKLIEVSLPLGVINDASGYDKMPGIGPHPKGLHQWWARLPLPTARAVLFASLVDDPSHDPAFEGRSEADQERERERLFGVIRDLLVKKAHEQPDVFRRAQVEIRRCCQPDVPVLMDPFCGGGSIPLEGQRLGLRVAASDLNPVAVLINKVQVEIAPRFAGRPPVHPSARRSLTHSGGWPGARGLAADVRHYGEWLLGEARKGLAHLYPKAHLPRHLGGGQAEVLTWIWARTATCPNPACRASVPLVSSFWLARKKGAKSRVWIEPVVDPRQKTVEFRIREGGGEAPPPTKIGRGARFRCLVCKEQVLDQDYLKAEGTGGRISSRLLALVVQGARGRHYVDPDEAHEGAARAATPLWRPDFEFIKSSRFTTPYLYGMARFSDLFTPRQMHALNAISDLVAKVADLVTADARAASDSSGSDERALADGGGGPRAYGEAVALLLGFARDRLADFNCALSRWKASGEQQMQLFGRAAIPMVWDYAEANVLADRAICWKTSVELTAAALEAVWVLECPPAQASQLDAASAPPPSGSIVVSTDPPYYDNIGYADLSDFFYVWLRRSAGTTYPQLFSTVLVPKAPELVAASERFSGDKDRAKEHFEQGFRRAFGLLRERLDPRFPLTVYYAFKQDDEGDDDADETTASVGLTTGWETLLESLVGTGFQVTSTWPVRASQAWRMRAMGSNALASYIVLACRTRSESAPLATRKEFVAALRRELPLAMKLLQRGSIAPVDLAQAAIGPGMAVFSRYARVIEADGSRMSVRTALGLINQVLDEVLAEQESEFEADTRWALAWFEQHGISDGPYGDAETLSKAKDTSVEALRRDGLLEAQRGKVRLRRREELPGDWNPATDRRLTVWEVTQHLIQRLEAGGESAAARLLSQVGSLGDVARDLAYRLFSICERKGWSQEATAYNSLVIAWPELVKLAAQPVAAPAQKGMF